MGIIRHRPAALITDPAFEKLAGGVKPGRWIKTLGEINAVSGSKGDRIGQRAFKVDRCQQM